MRRFTPMLLMAMTVAAAGCGSAAPTASDDPRRQPDASGIALTDDGSTTTLVTADGTSHTLTGVFRHARLDEGFPQDGRSADGRRLVLEDAANGASTTVGRFAIVDVTGARGPAEVTLDGDFDYDAVSPDLATLYLTNRFSVEDRERYQVRAYDTATGTLTERIVVDKSGRPEDGMSGLPVARAADPDGTWIYTLYRSRAHPFVHALESVNGYSVCIDLPEGAHVSEGWRLSYDAATRSLTATDPSGANPVTIDGTSFTASLGSLG